MNWEPNLGFTAENKTGKLHKTGHISNLIWWMEYSISSTFRNLSKNWKKYISYWEKVLNPLALYLQMLIMQRSTQTGNQKYNKKVTTKKYTIQKSGLKFQNPKFNILPKIAFFFFFFLILFLWRTSKCGGIELWLSVAIF